jgi:carbon monoxide dehydrogenase subunit G
MEGVTAMYQSEGSIDINVAPALAYGYLADFARHAEWSKGVAEMKRVNGDGAAVGSEFEATETVPMKLTSHMRIVTLDEPRRIAWDAWIEGMMKAHWEFELASAGGGTHLIQRCQLEPQSLLAKLMMALMRKRQIPKENAASLQRIKANLEAAPS